MAGSDLDVDRCIDKLRGAAAKGPGAPKDLSEAEIKGLCATSRDVFMSQPMLLELEAPIKICGDIHGQFYDLKELFKVGGDVPDTNYLFMGDFVDRGFYSVETFLLLLALKVRYPDRCVRPPRTERARP